MKLTEWQTYEWDLSQFPVSQRPKLPPFVFRQATSDDRDIVEKVICSALTQQPAVFHKKDSPLPSVETACDMAFSGSLISCVVVQHGSRIIGASAMDSRSDAENHLLTGPFILHEYENRGIGTALLFASLDLLKDAGLKQARGLALPQSTAARFVYSKFGGYVKPVVQAESVDSVAA